LPNQNDNGEDVAPDGSDSSPIENKSQVQVLVLLPCSIYCSDSAPPYILYWGELISFFHSVLFYFFAIRCYRVRRHIYLFIYVRRLFEFPELPLSKQPLFYYLITYNVWYKLPRSVVGTRSVFDTAWFC